MEQQGYLRTFRERWIAIVLAVIAGLGIAYVMGNSIAPVYAAKATLFLTVDSPSATFYERNSFSLQRIGSYPDLVRSQDVLQKTIDELNLDMTVQELSAQVSATTVVNTVLLEVTAEAGTPEEAAAIANSLAGNLADEVSSLENTTEDVRYSIALELRIPAQPPQDPIAPQMTVIMGIGFVAGLAVGLIIAILWARWDTGIRSVAHIRRLSGLPVLGELPRYLLPWRRSARSTERLATAFRDAQLTIRQANGARVPDFLLLAPASRSARAASVRRGFARTLALTGRSVLVIETEFTTATDGVVRPGFAEVLAGTHSLTEAIQPPADGEEFQVLGAGARAAVPKEYDAEQRMREVARDLVAASDVTILQTTSVTRPASLELVGPYVDGVVVVVRFGRTKTADFAHLLAQLRLAGLRPLGVVFTGVPRLRRIDLAATWLPEDFAANPRTPIVPLEDPVSEDTQPTAKAAPKPRTRRPSAGVTAKARASRTAAAAVEPEPAETLAIEEPAAEPAETPTLDGTETVESAVTEDRLDELQVDEDADRAADAEYTGFPRA